MKESQRERQRRVATAAILFTLVLAWSSMPRLMGQEHLVDQFPEAAQSGCMECHGEIEPIREIGSEMLAQIMQLGVDRGDPAGCVICHNGNPKETEDKEIAHGRDNFYPDPGSPWVNEETCGQCHEDQVRVQWQSLMMTEAGKIQGTCHNRGKRIGVSFQGLMETPYASPVTAEGQDQPGLHTKH